MSADEWDEWLASAHGGPLEEEMTKVLRAGLAVDQDRVTRVAGAAMARLTPARAARRWAWAVGAAALAAVALWAVAPRAITLDAPPPSVEPGPQGLPGVLPVVSPPAPQTVDLEDLQAALVRGDAAQAWQIAQQLRGVTSPGDADWAPLGEATARVADALHRQIEDPSSETAALAAAAYATYLEDFPAGSRDASVRYAYGELLYSMGRYADAWDQYTAVMTLYPESQHARFCAMSAVHAALQGMKLDDDREIWMDRLVSSADALDEAYPDHPDRLAVAYNAAYALYDAGSSQAVRRFDTIVTDFPTSREAVFAAQLVIDLHVRAGDWAAVQAAATRYAELLPGEAEELLEQAAEARRAIDQQR